MVKIDMQNDRLTEDQIIGIILAHAQGADAKKYTDNEKYFKGQNPKILAKEKRENGVPDNRVPVPYGRKVSRTTKNYMFNRDVIIKSKDTAFIEKINANNILNDYQRKCSEIGLDLIVHGYGFKLFYTDEKNNVRYAVIEPNEIIPVYSYDIEPRLIAAVRYYKKGGGKNEYVVEVYYKLVNAKYQYIFGDKKLTETEKEKAHGFDAVQVVPYGDNYRMGIFDDVKPIIDGIDTIASSDLDEIEKFALAYLVLTGQKLKPSDAKTIKEKRLFELEKESTLNYLTKQVDSVFNGSVRDFLIAEVHKQTGVPDFASKEFAAESGVALLYKLMGFENLASDIQSVFVSGEIESIKMQSRIINRTDVIPDDIWIEMTRNLPRNVMEKIQEAMGLKNLGISQETVLETLSGILPVEISVELEREEEERAAYVDLNAVPEIPPAKDEETAA